MLLFKKLLSKGITKKYSKSEFLIWQFIDFFKTNVKFIVKLTIGSYLGSYL